MARRDATVDTLRGIACFLLVSLHVVDGDPTTGWHFDYYEETFLYIRMPLFAFLSGLVYAWRPLTSPDGYGDFMSKKVRRVLVPYLIFVPLMGIARMVLEPGSGASNSPLTWLVYSVGPYWFLLATFWVYAVVALADSFGLLNRRWAVGLAFGVLLAVQVVLNPYDASSFLQFAKATYLGMFFLAGLAATRFGWRNASRRTVVIVAASAGALFVATQLQLLGVWDSGWSERQDLVGIALGIAFPLTVLGFGLSNRFVAWIGHYSYGIFLLHPFMVAGSRAAFESVGVSSTTVRVILVTAVGLFGSIGVVLVMRRFAIGRIALGERARRQPQPVA
ncbi:acyltransferase family protein [Demequina maris]|uniref:acyltransferase family protein n=1 Tax=Demequina maris TaxID=1638982 RepID=UPI000782AB70|nr:acyltransferase [Demequina maris]